MIKIHNTKTSFTFEFSILPKCLIFHEWGKWTKMYKEYNSRQLQYKKCKDCGRIEYRKISYWVALDMDKINNELESTT